MPTKSDARIAALEKQVKTLKKAVGDLTRALELTFEYALSGRAFTPAEERKMKAALGKTGGISLGNWKCGDYVCIAAGKLYALGDKSEIAFPAGGACPSVTSLGDGSDWQFTGNCHSC